MAVFWLRNVLRAGAPTKASLASARNPNCFPWSRQGGQCRWQHAVQEQPSSEQPEALNYHNQRHVSESVEIEDAESASSEQRDKLNFRLGKHSVGDKFKPVESEQAARDLLISSRVVNLRMGRKDYRCDPIFLRDCCECEHCRDPDSGQKNFDTVDIPTDISTRHLSRDASGNLAITWNNDIPGSPSEHTTRLSAELLRRLTRRQNLPSDSEHHPWTAIEFQNRYLTAFNYQNFIHNPRSRFLVLQQLKRQGLVFLNYVPKSEDSVAKIGQCIGPLRDTFYGRTWDVKDKPRAENVAYTSQHLGLHMDLLYMKNPPGYQLLHCIQSSAQGGHSLFSDSYKAAEIIEQTSPGAFHTLATFPVTYAYGKGSSAQGHRYEDSKPVFELPPYFQPSTGSSMTSCLQAVNWSPPFQGHLAHNRGMGDDSSALREWLRAANAFRAVISNSELTLSYKLKPGQCVIFNNRRVLHGRTAFDSNAPGAAEEGAVDQGPRWLKGTYIDTDVFESAYASLVETVGGLKTEQPQKELQVQPPADNRHARVQWV